MSDKPRYRAYSWADLCRRCEVGAAVEVVFGTGERIVFTKDRFRLAGPITRRLVGVRAIAYRLL